MVKCEEEEPHALEDGSNQWLLHCTWWKSTLNKVTQDNVHRETVHSTNL